MIRKTGTVTASMMSDAHISRRAAKRDAKEAAKQAATVANGGDAPPAAAGVADDVSDDDDDVSDEEVDLVEATAEVTPLLLCNYTTYSYIAVMKCMHCVE